MGEEAIKGFVSHCISAARSKSIDESIDFFDNVWSPHYDKEFKAAVSTGGFEIYSIALQYLKEYIKGPDSRILDVAGGSGLLAEKMVENNIKNVYLLDGSKEMIKLAQNKGIYKEIYEEILRPDTPSTVVPSGSFDIAIALNCFFNNCLGTDHIPVLLKMLKPGGKLIIGAGEVQEHDRTARGLTESIKKLVDTKSCKLIKAESFDYFCNTEKKFPGFSPKEPGMFYVIEYCP